MENFVENNNSRLEEQRRVMEEIIKNGDDPFSKENIYKYHSKPIIKEGKHWFVTESQWPYKNKKNQILFITNENIYDIKDLPNEAYSELLELAKWCVEKFEMKGGALCMRFGDYLVSGASVKHLHAQLIESDPEQGQVTFWIGGQK